MKNIDATSVSRFLSLVLRHRPDLIGLRLDAEGWASIPELIELAQPTQPLTREVIEEVVATSDKRRFSISDDGRMIRANQGHSVPVDLRLSRREPPSLLYHGTATRFLESILDTGLNAGERNHVHLSTDIVTAAAVGKRHGKVAILKIDAQAMHEQGFGFFLSQNGVWLTELVPARFLELVPDPAQGT